MSDSIRRVVSVGRQAGTIGLTYFLAWAVLGTWLGQLGERWFGRVPEGWAFCFPDGRPALTSGVILALLLGSIEARVGGRWRVTLLSFLVPPIVIGTWLFVVDASLEDARWWLSVQVPAIVVGTAAAVVVWARALKPHGDASRG